MIRLDFDFNADLLSMVKAIRGRRWSQTNRCWLIPDTMGNRERFGIPWSSVAEDRKEITTEEANRIALNQILLQKVKDKIQLKGYSQHTAKSYMNQLKNYLESILLNQDPTLMVKDDIELYLLKRQKEHSTSESEINSHINPVGLKNY